jgi:L-ascorbate metabolism protein UlaG (beta-lactamase superfamily)
MEKLLKLTYYYNSGFSVQVGGTLLVFDYWEGEDRILPAAYRLTSSYLQAFEQIFVFVSHGHMDHFDPIIYDWYKAGLPVHYIVSDDMPVGTRGSRLKPMQEKQLTKDISVKAFESTDLGVSFLVNVYGTTIFHAGDLNLWHWRSESSLKEIEEAEKAYEPLSEAVGALFEQGNPVGVKAALSVKGIIGNNLRLPLVPATESLIKKMEKLICEYELR